MSKGKVYITRRIPQPGLDAVNGVEGLDVSVWDSDDAIPKNELLKHVAGVDAILCMLTDPIDKEVLDAAGPSLKLVATMSVGYEHIDIAECKARGIRVTDTPGVSTDSVAEFTVTLLLTVTRRLLDGVDAVKKDQWGLWKPMWILGNKLHRSTVGILGFGRIGFGVAQRLKAFGVGKILYNDIVQSPFAKKLDAQFTSFEDICLKSDFICVCCNLTPETHHLLNAAAFAKMKKNVVIVNTGRGGVINHQDLYEALKSNEIRGAGLDVTDPEPLPHDHPLVSIPNCVITPHMGSNTWESRNDMARIAGGNIASHFTGGQFVGDVTAEKPVAKCWFGAKIRDCCGVSHSCMFVIPGMLAVAAVCAFVRYRVGKS